MGAPTRGERIEGGSQVLRTSTLESYDSYPCRTTIAAVKGSVSLRHDRLAEVVGARFRTERGTLASRAFGCLVEPRVGDVVMLGEDDEGRSYILQVLERPTAPGQSQSAELSLPGCETLSLSSKELSIQGAKAVAVRSGGDLELASVGGTLRMVAADIVSSAASSIVQLAQHWIGRAAQMSLDASALLRTHGRHHVMTASQEMRIDGERIHMG